MGGLQASPVTIQAEIGPDPSQKQSVYLVVTALMDSDWHIYSTTQPAGGPLPTKIQIDPSPDFEVGGEPMPLQEPKVHPPDPDIFNVSVEEHSGEVQWLIPITLAAETIPAELTITGTVKGLSCKGDLGGVCNPFESDFSASYRPDLEIAPLLQQGKEKFDVNLIETVEEKKIQSIWKAVWYAFLGGLVLNIMPCVLPVIGLKILSFFDQAGKSRARAFVLNLWYSLGIISVFMVLAFMSVGLNRLFTYSLFNIIMSIVIFAMALSLMDVWELRAPTFLGTGRSQKLSQQEGFFGAYYKGIITTLLAIPCGAPLLSPMLVWANNQVDAGATDLVFVSYAVIGLGMASPYLIIGAFPELISFLPKPGAWMETFKKVMGYLLLSAVVWLLYSMEIFNILPTITLLFAIWFALWLIGSLPPTVPKKKKTIAWTTSIVVVLLVWSISFPIAPFLFKEYNLQQAMQTKVQKKVEKQLEEWMVALDGGEKIALDQPGESEQDGQPGEPQEESEEEDIWKPFSFDRLETSLEEGRPVMIDFTADWCATCKVLEAMVLDTPEVENVVEAKNILPLRADFTRRPPDLAKLLNAMGGEQVPVVAIFLPEKPNNPIVLRGLFRQKTLLEKLEAIE